MTSLYLALLAMACVATLFVLWPLLRNNTALAEAQEDAPDRQQANVQLYKEHLAELDASLERGAIDEAQHKTLIQEQQRALLEDSAKAQSGQAKTSSGLGLLLVFALLLPLIAGIWYWQKGAAQDWEITKIAEAKYLSDVAAMQAGSRPSKQEAQKLIDSVQQRLKARPDNQQNWYLLARTAMEIPDYLLAVSAYQNILRLAPDSAGIMAELAQAMFLGNGNRMTPDVVAMADQALKLEANNTTALGLIGIAAFETKDYPLAIQSWKKAFSLSNPQAAGAQALLSGIARAESLMLESQGASPEGQVPAAPVLGTSIKVSVSIAPSLMQSGNIKPEQTVFIYARAWGAKMPLAIQRVRVADLPIEVSLDDSMAMAQGMGISTASELQVLARVSQDGGAIAKAGDWLGESAKLEQSSLPEEVAIVISKALP